MSECFSQKNGRVIVVDPSGPVRQMMTDVIRAVGFEKVEGRPSITETLQALETEGADWVIVPLTADQPANAMHLLKICSETPQLKNLRVSLCLAEDERYVIPTAFELGALSTFTKPFTKETLEAEIKGLLDTLAANEYNEVLTSASYLRRQLQSDKNYSAQVDLERSLLDLYPGNADILFNLVEPLFNLNRKTQARNTLNQVKLVDPAFASKVDDLSKKLFTDDSGADASEEESSNVKILGIKSCVLIDSDDTVCTAVEDILKDVGITEINKFSHGDEAWTSLEAGGEPELIIMEWRIPKLSGPMLVQKIRQKFNQVPIVVLSSLLKPTDMPLVREMGVANILSKPLHRDIFIPGLVYTMQQERAPTDQQAMERKIRNAYISGNKAEGEKLKAHFLADPQIPLSRKRQIEAEVAFFDGNFTMARDAAIESLKLAGDSIIILNLLGKTFMRLSDHQSALKCFKKAQDLSPHNIERLCNIAEVQTELQDEKAAEDALDSAKALDPDNKIVKDAEVKIAIAKGDVTSAKTLVGEMESLSSLVAYMNNKAVAQAKCGFLDEAKETYSNTMTSIPDNQQEARLIVQYNLALTLVRASDFPDAKAALEEVLKVKKSKVWAKANSLLTRLKEAMDKGSELHLRQMSQPAPEAASSKDSSKNNSKEKNETTEGQSQLSTEEDNARLISMVEARKGDLCCYMIYNHPGGKDARTASLLAKAPRFQVRDAIEREESMGVERVNKSA